jgi:hypothetical protein
MLERLVALRLLCRCSERRGRVLNLELGAYMPNPMLKGSVMDFAASGSPSTARALRRRRRKSRDTVVTPNANSAQVAI